MLDEEAENIKKIKEYLNEDKKVGNVILLDGSWGSGKTYTWNEKIKNNLKKKPIYVSLFGMKSLSSLKAALYDQYWKGKINIKNTILLIIVFCMLLVGYPLYILYSAKVIEISLPMNLDLATLFLITFFLMFLVFFIKNSSNIIIHLCNLFTGINHTNVPISRIFSKNKTFFCFDDLERLSDGAMDEFLGFIRTLANSGFNILVLSCYNYNEERNTLLYKEKVFDYQFLHSFEAGYQDITKDIDNLQLKDFLKKIFVERAIEAVDNIEKYSPMEQRYVKQLGANLRIVKKVKNNILRLYNVLDNVKKNFENSPNYLSILKFVTFITILNELGIRECKSRYQTHKRYSNFDSKHFYSKNITLAQRAKEQYSENGKEDTTKYLSFLDIIDNKTDSVEYICYSHLYDFIVFSNYDKGRLINELLPELSNKLTPFEKIFLEEYSKHWLSYRSDELRTVKNKLDKIIDQQENLFSSFETMCKCIGNYITLCHFLELSILNVDVNKIFSMLLAKTNNFIQTNKIELGQLHYLSMGWSTDDSSKAKEYDYAKDRIEGFIIKDHFLKMNFDKGFIKNLKLYLDDPEKQYLAIMNLAYNDKFFEEFCNLKEHNYAVYVELLDGLIDKIPSANQMNGICDKIGIPSSIFVRLENKLWYDLYKFSKDNNNKFSEKTLIERCQNKLNNTNFTENIIDAIQDINIWNDNLESSEPGNYGIEDFEVYVEDVKIDWDSNSFEADVTFNIDFIMGASRDGFIEPYHQNFLIDGNFIFNKQEGSLSTINVNTQNVCFDLYKSNNN